MGNYLNPRNSAFASSLNSEIYVDKTGLIAYTNSVLNSEQRFICASRPRRFGKSMAAEMLSAYYSCGCDSLGLFQDLEIANDASFGQHLNQYDVIYLDVQWFRNYAGSASHTVSLIQKEIIKELHQAYPGYVSKNDHFLPAVLGKINEGTTRQFVIIIDEWDCLFREDKYAEDAQDEYINLLRGLFKGTQPKEFVRLAYITGILPIKKYGTQSALNNFKEFTMINPKRLAKYVGFTEPEVKGLCKEFGMDFLEAQRWYDGYTFRRIAHVYNPKSVVDAMTEDEFENYWTDTETYESLKIYMDMNFDGLKDAVILMLGGGRHEINPRSFQNDMTTFKSKDDVLTLLVHLGYLAYDQDGKEVFIPNQEIEDEFMNAVQRTGWDEIMKAASASKSLLEATLCMDADEVAEAMNRIHMDHTSILNYHDENALSYVVSLAYYSAKAYYYKPVRELPSGKGFTDLTFLPRREYPDKPALIIELKWDSSAGAGIAQIKKQRYTRALEEYTGDILLIGINYDKKSKNHRCVIRKFKKVEGLEWNNS